MNFIIFALPRSRTAWLSSFLSYADWYCGHEQAIYMRSIQEVVEFLSRSCTGTVETAAAQGWRILDHHLPNLKRVVIKRPIDDVVASMMAIDLKGEFRYDETKLRKIMEYGDRMLADVSAQPGVLTLPFADLEREDACAELFEHCLPYSFDRKWWEWMAAQNVQVDVPSVIRYYHENRAEVDGFKSQCWAEMRRMARQGLIGRRHHAVS